MMIVVLVVFVSIVLGTARFCEPAKLGKIGVQTISFFLVTTAIALTIGMSVGLVLKPGKAGVFDTSNVEFSEQTPPTFVETLINIIPENQIEAMALGEMLNIIAFAILLGFSLAVIYVYTNCYLMMM